MNAHDGARAATALEVELLHVPNCPTVDETRALLKACLSELGLAAELKDREGPFPSPTIQVNGRDVMGPPVSLEASCRLDVPTRERLITALKQAVT
jgi:hypothetical protein